MKKGKKPGAREALEIRIYKRLEESISGKSPLNLNNMFYLFKNSAGEHLCGIDENDEPIFSGDYDQALYSYNQDRIQKYVEDNEISGVSLVSFTSGEGGNNPPQKPPF